MDLSLLRDNLPASSAVAQSDNDLLTNFKAAALSITTLYKSSLTSSKRSYQTGYAACLADVLGFIQAGLSAQSTGPGPSGGALGLVNVNVPGGGMSIEHVMDYLEARLETMRTEEDDEEEERAKLNKRASQPQATASTCAPYIRTIPNPSQVLSSQPDKLSSLQPHVDDSHMSSHATPPSPVQTIQQPLGSPSSSTLRPPKGTVTRSKSKSRFLATKPKDQHELSPKHTPLAQNPNTLNGTTVPSSSDQSSESIHSDTNLFTSIPYPDDLNLNVSIGSKRRHATAMALNNLHLGVNELGSINIMNDLASSSSRPTSSTRRRIRTANGLTRHGHLPTHTPQMEDAMDLEDEPARKRVSRR